MPLPNPAQLWPVIQRIIEAVDEDGINPKSMISALLFTAIYLAFRCKIGRLQLLEMMQSRWIEMELADGRAVWGEAGEA